MDKRGLMGIIIIISVLLVVVIGVIMYIALQDSEKAPVGDEFSEEIEKLPEEVESVESSSEDVPNDDGSVTSEYFSMIENLDKIKADYNEHLINGEKDKKIDVLFIPIDYKTHKDFLSDMERSIDVSAKNNGLLSIEPYKSNKDIFNFYYVSLEQRPFKELSQKYIKDECWKNECQDLSGLYPDLIGQWCEGQKEMDYVVQLWGGGNESYKDMILGGSSANKTLDFVAKIPDAGIVFAHEIGHNFGLPDLYDVRRRLHLKPGISLVLTNTYEGSSPYVQAKEFGLDSKSKVGGLLLPNMDEVGCPKWCEDYNRSVKNDYSILGDHVKCQNYKTKDDCFYDTWTNEFGLEQTSEMYCAWIEESLYKNYEPYFENRCIPAQLEVGDFDIGINCKPGTGCFYGAGGAGGWRATSEGSLMMRLYAKTYDPIEIEYIVRYIRAKYKIEMKMPTI